MRRSFIATALAVAIALAGLASTATQARAGDDYAKIIIGATALAIIGAAIASSHGNRYKPGYHHKPYASRGYGYGPRYYPSPRYGYRAGYRHGYHSGLRHGGGYGGRYYSSR